MPEKPHPVYQRRAKKPRSAVDGPSFNKTNVVRAKKRVRVAPKDLSSPGKEKKRWVELDFEGVDPGTFVGLACEASECSWLVTGGD